MLRKCTLSSFWLKTIFAPPFYTWPATPIEQGLYARYQFAEDPGPGCDRDNEAERKLKERLAPLVTGKRAG